MDTVARVSWGMGIDPDIQGAPPMINSALIAGGSGAIKKKKRKRKMSSE
jgi:hypothetical protein